MFLSSPRYSFPLSLFFFFVVCMNANTPVASLLKKLALSARQKIEMMTLYTCPNRKKKAFSLLLVFVFFCIFLSHFSFSLCFFLVLKKMAIRIVSGNVAFKTAAPLSRIAPAALLVQRRSTEYWGSTVTGRTQPFAQGDVLPRAHNTFNGSSKAVPNSAALTGASHNVTYDSNSMFDVAAQLGAERYHNHSHNGVFTYRVNPIDAGDSGKVVEVFDELITQKTKQQEHLWGRLFKDFPTLKTPLNSALQAEILEFYRAACGAADSEAAVEVLATPFIEKLLVEHTIAPHMVWRIAEKLSDAVELLTTERNRYERRACRNVIERVTKIALNTLEKKPWTHPDAVDPMQMEVGGLRAWHEAGNW